jgi:hypothetical protein
MIVFDLKSSFKIDDPLEKEAPEMMGMNRNI